MSIPAVPIIQLPNFQPHFSVPMNLRGSNQNRKRKNRNAEAPKPSALNPNVNPESVFQKQGAPTSALMNPHDRDSKKGPTIFGKSQSQPTASLCTTYPLYNVSRQCTGHLLQQLQKLKSNCMLFCRRPVAVRSGEVIVTYPVDHNPYREPLTLNPRPFQPLKPKP